MPEWIVLYEERPIKHLVNVSLFFFTGEVRHLADGDRRTAFSKTSPQPTNRRLNRHAVLGRILLPHFKRVRLIHIPAIDTCVSSSLPHHDGRNRTRIHAAHILRQLLLGFLKRSFRQMALTRVSHDGQWREVKGLYPEEGEQLFERHVTPNHFFQGHVHHIHRALSPDP